jgi:hypothetical protein
VNISNASRNVNISKATALKFVVLIGVVSLFADMTYEGARSIAGPYLAVLGASGTAVGIVAGLGELIGYGLRLISGYFSDRTGRYWAITIFGYTVNMLAVPLLALAGRWEIAVALVIAERIGKGIRFNHFRVDTASLTVFELDQGRATLVTANGTSHLKILAGSSGWPECMRAL